MPKADTRVAVAFFASLLEAVPYRIHTVLIDIGIQFADLPKSRGGLPPDGAAISSTDYAIFMGPNTG